VGSAEGAGPKRADCGATAGQLEVWFYTIGFPIRSCPENEIRAAPIGVVDTSGGLAGFVLPLSNVLCTGILTMLRAIPMLRSFNAACDNL
jgi:hypothetical protein